jgi:hypothetical protein
LRFAALGAANYAIAKAREQGVDPDNFADPANTLHVRKGLQLALASAGTAARTLFLKELENLVQEVPTDILVANVDKYAPSKKKDDDGHNAIAAAHAAYQTALKLKSDFKGDDIGASLKARDSLIKGYVARVQERVKETLAKNPDLDDKIRKLGNDFAAAVYGNRKYEDQEVIVLNLGEIKKAQEAFEQLVKDNKVKESYARTNLCTQLKTLVGDGKKAEKVDEAMQILYATAQPVKKAA